MTKESVALEMHRDGERKWPALLVPFDLYLSHCKRLFGDVGPSPDARAHGADFYLCWACAAGDPIAVRLFEDETFAAAQGVVARVHREPEFVKETLQELRKRMFSGQNAKVLDYRGRGPLAAWVRVAAARLALDRHRAERARTQRDTDLGDSLFDQRFGPESELTRARFYEPFREALDRAVLALPLKDRNLLRMHVVGQCSIDQIGRAYHVHRATAARWLEQTRGHLLATVRAELNVRGTALSDSEFRSVARLVGGELAVEIPPNSCGPKQSGAQSSN